MSKKMKAVENVEPAVEESVEVKAVHKRLTYPELTTFQLTDASAVASFRGQRKLIAQCIQEPATVADGCERMLAAGFSKQGAGGPESSFKYHVRAMIREGLVKVTLPDRIES